MHARRELAQELFLSRGTTRIGVHWLPQLSERTYPTPRTVRMIGAENSGLSTLSRTYLTYTSTRLVELSKGMFQTCSMIMARVTVWRAFLIRYSSRANSLPDRLIRLPARSTRYSRLSRIRSPTCRGVPGRYGFRRNSARTRAESSENENGLSRQSSAPVSSERTRSSTCVRAVKTRIGS